MKAFTTAIAIWMLYLPLLLAQADTVLFTPVAEYPFPAPFSAYTARFDRLGRPLIYTAGKENGVVIFDYSNTAAIQPVRTLSVQNFQGLKPTDLIQQGRYLYVSLGDFEGFPPQRAGLAIVDVENPAQATVLGQWSDTAFNKGSAAVRVDGDRAYLGAMDKGVVLIDVSIANAPKYVSHVALDINWPTPPGLFSVPHARGFALRNQELWTCFDAGGLRLVDVSDDKNPVEAVKYINTALDATAQPAYNTAAIAGHYLFAAVDYCGFEVVDITDPAQPQSAVWINPWDCNKSNWDGRPGHTNQVATACHDSLLFLSGADTEVLAYSIADPLHPHLAGQFGALKDSIVAWGVDVNDSLVLLAQIWSPINSPYVAKKGGIRLLRWSCPATTASPERNVSSAALTLTPNPAQEQVTARFNLLVSGVVQWTMFNMLGEPVRRETRWLPAGKQAVLLAVGDLPAGVYLFSVSVGGQMESRLMVKQ